MCRQGHCPIYLYEQIPTKVTLTLPYLFLLFLQYLFKHFYFYNVNYFDDFYFIELHNC